MKYVTPITDDAVVLTLKDAKHSGPLRCIRERVHGLLLSNRGFTLEQIAEILEIQYQTVPGGLMIGKTMASVLYIRGMTAEDLLSMMNPKSSA